jgi:hypothetical protein
MIEGKLRHKHIAGLSQQQRVANGANTIGMD